MDDKGGGTDAVDSLLALQVVELHKSNTGTHRTDDDILASHRLRIIGKLYRED